MARRRKEDALERLFHERVKSRGGLAYKLTPIGRRGKPDRIAFLPQGLMLLAELKDEDGELESHQAREHARLEKLGFSVNVIVGRDGLDAALPLTAEERTMQQPDRIVFVWGLWARQTWSGSSYITLCTYSSLEYALTALPPGMTVAFQIVPVQ